jgi:hypothetical protein
LALLRKLAKAGNYWTDVKLKLTDLEPFLVILSFGSDRKFADTADPCNNTTSELAYHYNALRELNQIEVKDGQIDRECRCGFMKPDSTVVMTQNGLNRIADADKSWLQKSIEKQPITWLQVIVTVVLAVIAGVGGWLIGQSDSLKVPPPDAVNARQPQDMRIKVESPLPDDAAWPPFPRTES